MTDANIEPDWSLWRSFEAVVSTRSLSGAARRLGLSQPTLGRHIEALETQLGINLFERSMRGLTPTDAALRLYGPVVEARNALAEARNMAEGQSLDLKGAVRITASTVISHYALPPMLAKMRERYPEIALEIVPSDSAENLLLREADIAIRMFRPTQLDLITKHLGDIPLVCCAHKDYLARKGTPETIQDLYTHDLIGGDRSELILIAARELGFALNRTDFIVRTDSQTLYWEAVKAGIGIGFAQESLVHMTPGLTPLLPGLALPPLPIWLTTHRELFTSRRIRAIYDVLAEELAHYTASLRNKGSEGR